MGTQVDVFKVACIDTALFLMYHGKKRKTSQLERSKVDIIISFKMVYKHAPHSIYEEHTSVIDSVAQQI